MSRYLYHHRIRMVNGEAVHVFRHPESKLADEMTHLDYQRENAEMVRTLSPIRRLEERVSRWYDFGHEDSA